MHFVVGVAGACLLSVTVLATPALAQRDPEQAAKDAEARAATFGLGAIVGVSTYNMLTTAVGAGVPAAGAAALGAAGAVGASAAIVWLRNTYNGERTEYRQLLPVSVGALAGVATGDALATGVMGYSPFAAAAGGFVPNFAFSVAGMTGAIYTYTTGVLGARVADALAGSHPKPR